jgi:hypothetical protein
MTIVMISGCCGRSTTPELVERTTKFIERNIIDRFSSVSDVGSRATDFRLFIRLRVMVNAPTLTQQTRRTAREPLIKKNVSDDSR